MGKKTVAVTLMLSTYAFREQVHNQGYAASLTPTVLDVGLVLSSENTYSAYVREAQEDPMVFRSAVSSSTGMM